jgi:hypothetical protein
MIRSIAFILQKPGHRNMRNFVLTLVGLFCAFVPGFAQSSLATISGAVTDEQGANIAGATVTANQEATGEHFAVKTNESGFYSISNLAVGAYSVSIEKEGFRRSVHPNIVLTTGIVLALDAKLEIGAVTETVDVSTDAPLVELRIDRVEKHLGSSAQRSPDNERGRARAGGCLRRL